MTLEAFANKIAAKAFITELNNARMLGHSATESFVLAMDSLDETFNRMFDAERPTVAAGEPIIKNALRPNLEEPRG